MSSAPKFSELSAEEVSWLADVRLLAGNLGADQRDPASIGTFFDASLDAVRSGAQPPETANGLVNTIAAVLGEHLREALDLEWKIVEDEFGTDLCLKARDSDWTLFPQSSVAKRWEAGERGWIPAFCAWAAEARPGPGAPPEQG